METPETVNVYSSDVHPFFFTAQFLRAKKVIKMSIIDFVSLAEKIGDPTVPVTWVSNIGRCGGTMLCQMFESVPGTLVIHELDAPQYVYPLRECNPISNYELILKSAICVLCKPRPGIDRICIKPRPTCSVMMTDITKIYPNIRQIFVYRNSLDTILSYVAAKYCEPYPAVICACADTDWFSNLCPYFKNFVRYFYVSKITDSPEIPQDSTTTCVFAYMWAYFILFARDAMSRDRGILSVKYEDILARPREAVRQIFEHLQIDTRHVDRAVSSLKRDSQRGSVMSRANLGETSNKCMSTVDRINTDAIFSKFNLPPLGEDFRI